MRKSGVILSMLILLSAFTACQTSDNNPEESTTGALSQTVISTENGESSGNSDPSIGKEGFLSLNFDEGSGNTVTDGVSGENAVIEYVFTDAVYKGDSDPRWIENSAIRGTALAFDGYSNYIRYPSSVVQVCGSKLTVDLYLCPRYFEWDDPNALANGTAKLQVVLEQFDGDTKSGFSVGLHKYGDYCFRVGTGDAVYSLWNSGERLETYTWSRLTCVFDSESGYMAIYKDGKLVSQRNDVKKEIAPCESDLLIGKGSTVEYASEVFQIHMYGGILDELRILDTAMTAEEIADSHKEYTDESGALPEAAFADALLDESILDDDPYHPVYHATPPQHWMNEPHSLFYYNGYYHLFYQFNIAGPYWRQICWGHWVSEDMVTWTNVREALVMEEGSVAPDGIWSGCATYKADGTPVLVFTAGDDACTTNPYSIQNMAIAVPADPNDPYLTEWVMSEVPVAKLTSEMGVRNEFRDPSVYYEDGVWYMVVGSSGYIKEGEEYPLRGKALLFTSTDPELLKWEYKGSLLTLENYTDYLGTMWELPNFRKVKSADGKIEKYIVAVTPCGPSSDNDCYYWLGDFDPETGIFTPDTEEPQLMDFGNNVFTGVTLAELPDGRVIACSIIQDQRSVKMEYLAGWAHAAGMPRELLLDADGSLLVRPIAELDSYKGTTLISLENVTAEEADKALGGLQETQIYLKMVLSDTENGKAELIFKEKNSSTYAQLTYDFSSRKVSLNTSRTSNSLKGSFGGILPETEDGTLTVEMYIDGAMTEIYLNGCKTITAMIYDISPGMSLKGKRGALVVEELVVQEFTAGQNA